MPMTHRVEPFAGLLYDPERVGVLSNVVAPPYDLIDKAQQDALYARSLYNVVRLELNRDPDRYASAARTLGEWLKDGVLKRRSGPRFICTRNFLRSRGACSGVTDLSCVSGWRSSAPDESCRTSGLSPPPNRTGSNC